MRLGDSQASMIFVYISGNRWENVEGTDQRLATALAGDTPVLWIDPPLAVHRAFNRHRQPLFRGIELRDVAPGVTRVRWLFVPGASTEPITRLTSAALSTVIRRSLKLLGASPFAVMCTSPVMTIPHGISGTKVLYVTDDWISGAQMMGLSSRLVKQNLARNLHRAHMTLAVSPHLVHKLNQEYGLRIKAGLLPNGCALPAKVATGRRNGTAGLVGTLNERLDIGLLEKLTESRIPLLVIGPRTDTEASVGLRLDRVLAADSVRWLGALPAASIPGHLSDVSVGLTPYRNSEFNRASFPLKTLDYLAAGLPVVATDLPAVRWLDSEYVAVARDHSEFLSLVDVAVHTPTDPAIEERRRAFAMTHSWNVRSSTLLTMLDASAWRRQLKMAPTTTKSKHIMAGLPED